MTRSTYHREPARLHWRIGFEEQATKAWLARCGAGGERFVATTANRDQVDCGRCLRIIRKYRSAGL